MNYFLLNINLYAVLICVLFSTIESCSSEYHPDEELASHACDPINPKQEVFASDEEELTSPERAALESSKILIIEDHPVNRMIIKAMLEPLGVGSIILHPGDESVFEFLASLKGDDVDLIISDYNLEKVGNNLNFVESDDGYALADKEDGEKEITVHIVGSMIAACLERHEELSGKQRVLWTNSKQGYHEAGFNGALSKPFIISELVECLRNHLL